MAISFNFIFYQKLSISFVEYLASDARSTLQFYKVILFPQFFKDMKKNYVIYSQKKLMFSLVILLVILLVISR